MPVTPEMADAEAERERCLALAQFRVQQERQWLDEPNEYNLDVAIKELMIGSHSGRIGTCP